MWESEEYTYRMEFGHIQLPSANRGLEYRRLAWEARLAQRIKLMKEYVAGYNAQIDPHQHSLFFISERRTPPR